MSSVLSEPVRLPCGLEFPNRLVKAALAEDLSPKDHNPNSRIERMYGEWGTGGWGAILTGNVMVDDRYCGGVGDIAIHDNTSIDEWKGYATASQKSGTPALVQLNHVGRQSPMGAGTRSVFEKTMAPSAIPLDLGTGLVARAARAVLFGTPRAMSLDDIQTTVRQFADSAKLVHGSGFSGVEIHAAHGYLLAQFLSEKSNQRTDSYGGSVYNRARIVVEVIKAIRSAVPPSFCVGIKLNSTDHQNEKSLEETLEQIACIVDAGIDFLEISGGTYEDPQMMQNPAHHMRSARSAKREAFFLDFAKATRARFPDVKLMLTGGFRSRAAMESAVREHACDLVGLGRPAVANPQFAKEVLLNQKISDSEASVSLPIVPVPSLLTWFIPAVGAGAETVYYQKQIRIQVDSGVAKSLSTAQSIGKL